MKLYNIYRAFKSGKHANIIDTRPGGSVERNMMAATELYYTTLFKLEDTKTELAELEKTVIEFIDNHLHGVNGFELCWSAVKDDREMCSKQGGCGLFECRFCARNPEVKERS